MALPPASGLQVHLHQQHALEVDVLARALEKSRDLDRLCDGLRKAGLPD